MERLRSSERLVHEGRYEEAISSLRETLDEARGRDDSYSLARILTLAQEIRARGRDYAGAEAVCAAARDALFSAPGEDGDLGREELYAPSRSRRASLRLPGGLVLMLVVAVAANVGVRIVVDRLGSDDFAPPEIRVVPADTNHERRREIASEGVFLVPLDGMRAAALPQVARQVEKIGVSATVLPRLRSEDGSLNDEREQLEGDALIQQLWRTYPTQNPRTVIIGVTNGDLYWAGAGDDRFSFGVVADRRYAVVSIARMDPSNYGDSPDDRLVEERLRKMVIRYVGSLYFGLERTSNDQSVMRSSIRALSDLDKMSDEFCPQRPGEIATC